MWVWKEHRAQSTVLAVALTVWSWVYWNFRINLIQIQIVPVSEHSTATSFVQAWSMPAWDWGWGRPSPNRKIMSQGEVPEKIPWERIVTRRGNGFWASKNVRCPSYPTVILVSLSTKWQGWYKNFCSLVCLGQLAQDWDYSIASVKVWEKLCSLWVLICDRRSLWL